VYSYTIITAHKIKKQAESGEVEPLIIENLNIFHKGESLYSVVLVR
jgi:hypothetical protein